MVVHGRNPLISKNQTRESRRQCFSDLNNISAANVSLRRGGPVFSSGWKMIRLEHPEFAQSTLPFLANVDEPIIPATSESFFSHIQTSKVIRRPTSGRQKKTPFCSKDILIISDLSDFTNSDFGLGCDNYEIMLEQRPKFIEIMLKFHIFQIVSRPIITFSSFIIWNYFTSSCQLSLDYCNLDITSATLITGGKLNLKVIR